MTTSEEVMRAAYLVLGRHGWHININGERCVCGVTTFKSMAHHLAQALADANLLRQEMTEETRTREPEKSKIPPSSKGGRVANRDWVPPRGGAYTFQPKERTTQPKPPRGDAGVSIHPKSKAGSVEMSADSPTQVGESEDRLLTTEEANDAAASYVKAPMTDERLAELEQAELEQQAAEQPFAMSEDVRELAVDVRRLRRALDASHKARLGDLKLATRLAEKCDALEAKLAAARSTVDRVRELHRPHHIYDECSHDHEYPDDGVLPDGVVEIEEIGLTCADEFMYSICWECCTDGEHQREGCADSHRHDASAPICRTVELLDGGGTNG